MKELTSNIEVMVVDDQPENRRDIRNILLNQGFKVVWQRSWEETKNMLKEKVDSKESFPDIALVDMHFEKEFCSLSENPAIEGTHIIRALADTCRRNTRKNIPVIAFTKREDYLEREEMLKAGAMDFITAQECMRPSLFKKRLLECILHSYLAENAFPFINITFDQMEDQIVKRILSRTNGNTKQASNLLDWPLERVSSIKERLEYRGGL